MHVDALPVIVLPSCRAVSSVPFLESLKSLSELSHPFMAFRGFDLFLLNSQQPLHISPLNELAEWREPSGWTLKDRRARALPLTKAPRLTPK